MIMNHRFFGIKVRAWRKVDTFYKLGMPERNFQRNTIYNHGPTMGNSYASFNGYKIILRILLSLSIQERF